MQHTSIVSVLYEQHMCV